MAKETIFTFEEYGEETADVLLLFSPFIPFNNLAINDFFYNSTIKYKKVYTNFSPKIKPDENTYTYDNILYSYTEYIKNQKQKTIFIIGFGIFANLFTRIAKIMGSRITSLILIEPDFGNSILQKLFDSDSKPVHKKRYFEESFTKDFDVPKQKKFLVSHYFKHLKTINTPLREYLPQKVSLKEILEVKEITLIMWHLMEKDLWPLPQILQEDYGIKTISAHNNIISDMIVSDRQMLANVNAYITEKINNL
ncbi:MAG: hypothetical protein J6Y01_01905 [Spirochaetales bacterium]|nr:hypothetical protein [Spirochaetales bacterium]